MAWSFPCCRSDANVSPARRLEVGVHQVVRTFAAALINLRCRRADQVPMRIERAQQPRLVEPHVGLDALQRVLGDEECNLHRAVVSPEAHRPPRTARARRYPLNRATRLLYAMTTAAMPKQAAEANARLNTVIHMSRSS